MPETTVRVVAVNGKPVTPIDVTRWFADFTAALVRKEIQNGR